MTLTPKDLVYIYNIDLAYAKEVDVAYPKTAMVEASKVADELERIMSATAEIDWSKEQYSYMNDRIRELKDILRGSSQEGKR